MTKAEKVDAFIRRRVREAMLEVCNELDCTTMCKALIERVPVRSGAKVSMDAYRLKELADIMAWRKPPRVKE